MQDEIKQALAFTEEELNRIVLDVHDGPVQKLFAAMAVLEQTQDAILRYNPTGRSLLANLNKISSLIESSLTEIRSFLGTFRSPEFDKRSLASIIESLVIQQEELGDLTLDLKIEKLPDEVPLPVKIVLYRILQEALSNTFRHSGAQNQWIRLWMEDEKICMEAVDDGRGFTINPQMADREEHIGLRGMRERARRVNGQFALESSPGKGTRITVRVPAHE
ncbi:MAG: sensor histidine kinase [Anaerolineae bacterium]|nr:sensor histidine kinase [Anaerolineae bacterium]